MVRPVNGYYDTWESRIGYWAFLGGTRHYGYYPSRWSWPFSISKALRAMEQKLLDALGLPAKSKVLDCGCGHGYVALYMAQQGGLAVQGIDIVDHHIVNARKNIARNGCEAQVSVDVGDYMDLSRFSDGEFDGLYTMDTLTHAPDPEKALRGFFRVLRPGGVIVEHEYDHDSYEKVPKWLKDQIKFGSEVAYLPGYDMFEPGVLENLLLKVGFVNVEVKDFSENVMPMIFLLYVVAFLPYQLVCLLGLKRYFINTVGAYESWTGRMHAHYLQYKARKP